VIAEYCLERIRLVSILAQNDVIVTTCAWEAWLLLVVWHPAPRLCDPDRLQELEAGEDSHSQQSGAL